MRAFRLLDREFQRNEGNPKVKEYTTTLLTYSPYDNVDCEGLPNLPCTSGFARQPSSILGAGTKWSGQIRELKKYQTFFGSIRIIGWQDMVRHPEDSTSLVKDWH